MGYNGGTICVAVANRATNRFATDIQDRVHGATMVALEALKHLRQPAQEN